MPISHARLSPGSYMSSGRLHAGLASQSPPPTPLLPPPSPTRLRRPGEDCVRGGRPAVSRDGVPQLTGVQGTCGGPTWVGRPQRRVAGQRRWLLARPPQGVSLEEVEATLRKRFAVSGLEEKASRQPKNA